MFISRVSGRMKGWRGRIKFDNHQVIPIASYKFVSEESGNEGMIRNKWLCRCHIWYPFLKRKERTSSSLPYSFNSLSLFQDVWRWKKKYLTSCIFMLFCFLSFRFIKLEDRSGRRSKRNRHQEEPKEKAQNHLLISFLDVLSSKTRRKKRKVYSSRVGLGKQGRERERENGGQSVLHPKKRRILLPAVSGSNWGEDLFSFLFLQMEHLLLSPLLFFISSFCSSYHPHHDTYPSLHPPRNP